MKALYALLFFLASLSLTSLQGCFGDPCSGTACEQGECIEGDCLCLMGWGGANCDKRANAFYAGDYTVVDDSCHTTGQIPGPYSTIVFASASTPENFTIAGVFGEAQNLGLVHASVNFFYDSFTVVRQPFSNDGLEIEGEGNLTTSPDAGIYMSYRLYQGQAANSFDSCRVWFVRQ